MKFWLAAACAALLGPLTPVHAAGPAADSDYPPPIKDGPSLEWQKVGLEERLHDKISRAIAPSVPANHFVVSVSIDLKKKEAAKPADPAAPADPKAAAEDPRVPLGKLDLDARPYGADEEENDLFKNIVKVNVSVLLDNSVPDAKQDTVKKIVAGSVRGIGEQEAAVTLEKTDLVPAPEPEKWDARRWLVELKIPLGVLGATLIFSLMFMTVFGGYRKLERQKIAVMEAQNSREEAQTQAAQASAEKEEKIEVGEDKGHGEGGDATMEVKIEGVQSGFDKFHTLLKETPERASALIKQWVKAPASGAAEALALLPQILTTDELLSVFKYLSLDERKEWKKMLNLIVDQKGARVADAFVAGQIVDSLLVPAPKIEDDVREKIAELKLSECVELATQNPSVAALLVNVLPTVQVGRMLALLPPELANSSTVASLKYSDEEIKAQSEALKSAITALKSKPKTSGAPFLDRAAELLREVGPAKESSIFGALAESGELVLFEEAARRFFPAELITKLPARVIKVCLDRLPLSRRAELIISRADEEKAVFLDAIGKPGSKLRDLIDVEISEVAGDEVKRKRIDRNRDQAWREFTDLARTLMRNNEAVAEQAEGVLNAWLSEKTNGQLGGGPAAGGASDDGAKAA